MLHTVPHRQYGQGQSPASQQSDHRHRTSLRLPGERPLGRCRDCETAKLPSAIHSSRAERRTCSCQTSAHKQWEKWMCQPCTCARDCFRAARRFSFLSCGSESIPIRSLMLRKRMPDWRGVRHSEI
jgi:hypothetical protein